MLPLRTVPLLLTLALTPACNHFLAERIVAPPNGGHLNPAQSAAPTNLATNEPRLVAIPVGPPVATLAAWVLDPEPNTPSRGTILLLHGILANHDWLRQTTRSLHDAGFRTVVVDLRGHGLSTGDHITYGVIESRDLRQLTDYLQSQKLAGPTIGVYGCSYGAATAIQYAAADPRVTAVVAVASFSNLYDEAPNIGRNILPVPGLFLSKDDYTAILADAGNIAGFAPASASPLDAITKTNANILLIHGDLDRVTP